MTSEGKFFFATGTTKLVGFEIEIPGTGRNKMAGSKSGIWKLKVGSWGRIGRKMAFDRLKTDRSGVSPTLGKKLQT